ncbi:hypothetical protein T4C_5312, partial [Trichinella pseudospiralis]
LFICTQQGIEDLKILQVFVMGWNVKVMWCVAVKTNDAENVPSGRNVILYREKILNSCIFNNERFRQNSRTVSGDAVHPIVVIV